MLAVFTKKIMRWIFASLFGIIFVLPLLLVCFLGVFKDKIQRGKMLPGFGEVLLLVSPPKDLFEPLAMQEISPNQQEYDFVIKHKYVGNHVIDISVGRLGSMDKLKNDFKVRCIVQKDGQVLYDETLDKGWSYWGGSSDGLTFQRYRVPQDLPIDTLLKVKVIIEGDLNSFVSDYGPTKLIIRKGSDE